MGKTSKLVHGNQLTSHKDISYILYFCKHETEYTRSLSDQTIQMVHIGYAYHRAFLRKTRIRITGMCLS